MDLKNKALTLAISFSVAGYLVNGYYKEQKAIHDRFESKRDSTYNTMASIMLKTDSVKTAKQQVNDNEPDRLILYFTSK